MLIVGRCSKCGEPGHIINIRKSIWRKREISSEFYVRCSGKCVGTETTIHKFPRFARIEWNSLNEKQYGE